MSRRRLACDLRQIPKKQGCSGAGARVFTMGVVPGLDRRQAQLECEMPLEI